VVGQGAELQGGGWLGLPLVSLELCILILLMHITRALIPGLDTPGNHSLPRGLGLHSSVPDTPRDSMTTLYWQRQKCVT